MFKSLETSEKVFLIMIGSVVVLFAVKFLYACMNYRIDNGFRW